MDQRIGGDDILRLVTALAGHIVGYLWDGWFGRKQSFSYPVRYGVLWVVS